MLERIMCAILGHRYVVERRFSEVSRKVGCTRCPKKWAMNDRVRAFVPWDKEFEEFYNATANRAAMSGKGIAQPDTGNLTE